MDFENGGELWSDEGREDWGVFSEFYNQTLVWGSSELEDQGFIYNHTTFDSAPSPILTSSNLYKPDSPAGGRKVQSLQYPPMETLRGGIEDEIAQFPGEITEESDLDIDEIHLVAETGKHALEYRQMGVMALEHEEHITQFDQDTFSYYPNDFAGHENSQLATRNGQNNKKQQSECLKGKGKKSNVTLEEIQSFWSKNMSQEDAGKILGFSRSTMKRRLRELGIQEWQSSRRGNQRHSTKKKKHGHKSACSSERPQLKPVNNCNLAQGPASECLIGETQIYSGSGLIECCSVARQHSIPSTFVVKAKYKEDTVRIDFSCNSSVNKLKKEVGKRFKLELSRFKINYLDEDKECMLMTDNSDLQHALRASTSSGSKIIRLLISDL